MFWLADDVHIVQGHEAGFVNVWQPHLIFSAAHGRGLFRPISSLGFDRSKSNPQKAAPTLYTSGLYATGT
jgi:hypothetical protein